MQAGIDDSIFDVLEYSPVCMGCTHVDILNVRKCAAFDEDIPLEIWEGKNDHRQPYPGDHGILFEDARELSAVPA